MSTAKFDTLSTLDGSQSVPVNTVAQGSAKAWVNFNGTGTVAIRASFNVTSITDNGTGDYTLNFTTALQDANYSITGSCRSPGVTSGGAVQFDVWSTSSNRFYTRQNSAGGANFDFTYISVAIFR
jgi:hypothetical protein